MSFTEVTHLGAAVSMIFGNGPIGVTRLVQVDQNSCVIEGTIDGLQPAAKYALNVHELGDLSQGCDRYDQVSYH